MYHSHIRQTVMQKPAKGSLVRKKLLVGSWRRGGGCQWRAAPQGKSREGDRTEKGTEIDNRQLFLLLNPS